MANLADGDVPIEVTDLLTWLRVERGRSVNTLNAYRLDLRAYVAWLALRGLTVAEVTEADLDAYVGHLRTSGKAASSVKR